MSWPFCPVSPRQCDLSNQLSNLICLGLNVWVVLFKMSCLRRPVQSVLSRLSCSGSHDQSVLSRLSWHVSPFPAVMSQLSCAGCFMRAVLFQPPCPATLSIQLYWCRYPIIAGSVLYRLTCPVWSVKLSLPAVLSLWSCSRCPIPALLPRLYCLSCPSRAILSSCPALALLSLLSSPCCYVLAILSYLSCPGWPLQADLSSQSIQTDLSGLSCPIIAPQCHVQKYCPDCAVLAFLPWLPHPVVPF